MEIDLKKLAGQRLQLLRLEKNLTQEQMSEKLHLSTSAYCKIEYGETDLTLTRLHKIAEVLDMSAIDLFKKIKGSTHFNQSFVGITKDGTVIKVENNDDLRELIKANSKMVDMLHRRIEILEKRLE